MKSSLGSCWVYGSAEEKRVGSSQEKNKGVGRGRGIIGISQGDLGSLTSGGNHCLD